MDPKKPTTPAKEPTLAFATPKAWNTWLAANHASSTGVLVKIGKKGGDEAHLTYAEALEVALIWGWIDGQKRKHDDHAWLQRFTPRRARSLWSKINREKAEALIRDGKMKPAGLSEVVRAKNDGRWAAAYDSPRSSTIPADLLAALAKNARANAFFAAIDGTNRYAILHRLQTAKKAETRAKRIAVFVAMLAKHETLYPPRKSAKRA